MILSLLLLLFPLVVSASTTAAPSLHATSSQLAILSLIIFIVAYFFVVTEELTHLRKSKPVVISAGIIWALVGCIANTKGLTQTLDLMVHHYISEFATLFMFLLVAMTYINAMDERLIFESVKISLIKKNYTFRQLFWVTGLIAFFLSPIADNLTTALLMCAVVMSIGKENKKFISVSCINIVIAANAGGAFSPFGDITTLMIWQSGMLGFSKFFFIFLPSLISYLVPAVIMSYAIPKQAPNGTARAVKMKYGSKVLIILFILTIITAICFHHYLHLPPMLGMMTGLGYLNFFSYYVNKVETKALNSHKGKNPPKPFDIFNKVKRAEWDTLFFFYGVILSVGGLAVIGYLEITATFLYKDLAFNLPRAYAALPANLLIGILSAIFDNIPITYAVLEMKPVMSDGHWLLVTLTAGIGGSLLSIGSAAGVALMGQARSSYTFMSHLKWTPVIFIGFICGIISHLFINNQLF